MNTVAVAGGCYRETCTVPEVDEIYGSGGRAAIALASAGCEVDWHYYCPKDFQSDVRATLNLPGIKHQAKSSDQFIEFQYFHPLSRPFFSPRNIIKQVPLAVSADAVLQFGFMEGEARVEAGRCVYDPQSPDLPIPFKSTGSTANELAIVLNSTEVLAYASTDNEKAAVKKICDEDAAKVVLVKDGVKGCRVYEDGSCLAEVPPYRSQSVYKIGSGDQFSATFFHEWAVLGRNPVEAADTASRSVARYCETRSPRVNLDETGLKLSAASCSQPRRIYIAGPFFTISELWLIEEIFASLTGLGVEAFSPYHHVGFGEPEKVVSADLNGLEDCGAMLAVLDGCDPGTLFEIGYAIKMGIPVIALSQNPKKGDLTMLAGSELCTITDDFATALYVATWAAML